MPPIERTRLGLWIEPLDVLFFRGGRPFGPATRAEGGLPQPQTLAGALRTALLTAARFDFATFLRQVRNGVALVAAMNAHGAPPGLTETLFRGPWLARRSASSERVEPLLPIPLNLFRADDGRDPRWYRSDPLGDELPGWAPPQPGRRPLWHRGDPDAKRVSSYLKLRGIEAFLRGGCPDDADWEKPDQLHGFDHRTGLEIDADSLTGIDGRLFTTRLLALKPGIGFYAEVLPPCQYAKDLQQLLGGPFPWGGEGRYAMASVLGQPVAWPNVTEGGNPLWLLASSAPLVSGQRTEQLPDRIDPDDLVAVASGPGLAISGWDLARGGPRPTRFAAPAGSVYFTASPAPIGPESSLCGDPEDLVLGWGFALRGVWNHA